MTGAPSPCKRVVTGYSGLRIAFSAVQPPTRLSVKRPLPRPFYVQSSFATQLTVLEDKLRCKLKLSCCTCDAIDHTEELYVADVVMGLTQVYVVQHIECLGPELELPPFPNRENAKERSIQVPIGRTPEGIASCVAESRLCWRGKHSGIEPLPGALLRKPGIPHFIQMFITSPPCLPGICPISTDDGSKSNARMGLEQVVNLPAAHDVIEHTVSSGKSLSPPNRNFVKRVHR